jgi:ketosteroid isomerase-like protein
MSGESTPPDGVASTRRFYDALNARDVDAVLSMFDPDLVWDVSRWGLGEHGGHRAIRNFLDDWMGEEVAYRVEVAELDDLGQGVVLVVVVHLLPGTGGSGILPVRSATVFEWAGSTATRITAYRDIDEGRAAARRLAGLQH